MTSNIIRGGYDYHKSLKDGLYAVHNTKQNLTILSENQEDKILLNLYPSKNSLIPIQVSISKYSYRIINDSELNYLKQKYHWEPVQPKYGTNWKLLIEFQYSNVVFPKSTKIQTNTITRYFQKQ